jgi:hypothetical protein
MSGVEGPDDQNPYREGTQDGVNIGWGSITSALPSFISDDINLIETIFKQGPRKWLRGFVFGGLLTGLAKFLNPIFETLITLSLGSNPAEFGAPDETWGIADVPVVVARVGADAISSVIVLVFEAYNGVLQSLLPSQASPVAAPLAAFALVLTGFVLYRIAAPTVLTALQAGLEAVPVVGGPLATIIGDLRS